MRQDFQCKQRFLILDGVEKRNEKKKIKIPNGGPDPVQRQYG